jgi:hypothetical protein
VNVRAIPKKPIPVVEVGFLFGHLLHSLPVDKEGAILYLDLASTFVLVNR